MATPPSGAMNLGTLLATLGLDNAPLRRGEAEVRSIFGRMQRNVTGDVRAIVGSMVAIRPHLIALAASIAGAFSVKEITQFGNEFDVTMRRLAIAVDGTADEMRALRKASLDVGMATTRSASEAGRALISLKKSGLIAAQAIEALPEVLKLAKFGSMDLARTADTLLDTMNLFGIGTERTAETVDILALAASKTKGDLDALAAELVIVAPIARQLGYSLEEVAAILTVLIGAQVSGAGQKLSQSLIKANEAAVKLGLSSGDIVDVLREMERRGTSAAEMFEFFGGARLGGRVSSILRQNADEVRRLQEEFANAESAAVRLGDVLTKGQAGIAFKKLVNTIRTIGVELFEAFGGSAARSLDRMRAWIVANREDIVKFGKATVSALKEVGSVLGELVRDAAGLTSHVVRLFSLFRSESRSTAAALLDDASTMRGALSAPPELTVWDEFWGDLGKWLREFIADARTLFEYVTTTAVVAGKIIIKDVIGNILEATSRLLDALVLVGQFKFTEAGASARAALSDIKDVVDDMVETYRRGQESINESWRRNRERVTLSMPDEWGPNVAETRAAVDAVSRDLSTLSRNAEGAGDALLAHQRAISDAIKKQWQDAKGSLGATLQTMQRGLRKIVVPSHAKPPQPLGEDEMRAIREEQRRVVDMTASMLREIATNSRGSRDELVATWSALAPILEKQFKAAANEAKILGVDPAIIKQWEDFKKTVTGPEERRTFFMEFDRKSLDDQIGAYETILEAGGSSIDGLKRLWSGYVALRLGQVKLELDATKLSEDEKAQAIQATVDLLGREYQQRNLDILGSQAEALAGLLSEERTTKDDLQAVWREYEAIRLRMIDEIRTQEIASGLSVTAADALELKRRRELYDEHAQWMKRWALLTGEQVREAFSATLFHTIKADWEGLLSALEGMVDAWIRRLTDRLADLAFDRWFTEQTSSLGGAVGFGWRRQALALPGIGGIPLGAIPEFREGGVVRKPILAVVGEAGPEAVVPLNDISEFRRGGVVRRPTLALIGEAGPEAVVPLAGIPEFQHGGLVREPTLAMIGEAGPEAVVPLTRSRFRRFADRFLPDEGGTAPMNVTVNVSTPDLRSFRESRAQIGTALAAEVRRAQRNL